MVRPPDVVDVDVALGSVATGEVAARRPGVGSVLGNFQCPVQDLQVVRQRAVLVSRRARFEVRDDRFRATVDVDVRVVGVRRPHDAKDVDAAGVEVRVNRLCADGLRTCAPGGFAG